MLHVIGNQKPQGKPFAMNIAVHDIKGNIKMKYIEAESGSELYQKWIETKGVPKKKKYRPQTEATGE